MSFWYMDERGFVHFMKDGARLPHYYDAKAESVTYDAPGGTMQRPQPDLFSRMIEDVRPLPHIQSGASIVPRDARGMAEQATRATNEGIERAAIHAERVWPTWNDGAMGYVKEYFGHHAVGTCEDVRKYATSRGFANPPDGRAWGAVMRNAAKAGLVTKGGWTTATDPKVHNNPVRQWMRAL